MAALGGGGADEVRGALKVFRRLQRLSGGTDELALVRICLQKTKLYLDLKLNDGNSVHRSHFTASLNCSSP